MKMNFTQATTTTMNILLSLLIFFIIHIDGSNGSSFLQCPGFVHLNYKPCSSTNKHVKCRDQRLGHPNLHQLNFMQNLDSDPRIAQSQSHSSSSSSHSSSSLQTRLYAVPTLDNWTITKNGEAIGRVSNHPSPSISDGEMVTTSKLRNASTINAREGLTVITASGSKYKLGRPKATAQGPGPGPGGLAANFFRSGSNNLRNGTEKKNVLPQNVVPPKRNTKTDESDKLEGPLVEDWFISFGGELIGIITGHPDKNIIDGDTVTTSRIRNDRNTLKEGDVAITANGSKYVLGKKKRGLPTTLFQNGESSNGSRSVSGMISSGSNGLSRTFGLLNKQIAEAVANISSSKSASSGSAPVVSQTKLEKERLRLLKQRYGINGKTLANGKYLLCGKAKRSTSGKSNIWSAYKADGNGIPVGDKLTIKVSTNFDSMTREENNYNRVCSGLFPGRFVDKAEFLENLDGYPAKEFDTSCALVIENGKKDLRAILNERGGRGFEGRAMRDAASAALQCIQAMHSSGIVWTDLKTENFVIVSDEIGDNGMLPGVKGIDLESAIPRGKNPVDFSPEACPPEFASAFISGQGLTFKLDYSYDIWSYGMMLYELTTGKPYFDNLSPAKITMSLQYEFEPDLSNVQDDKLRDLIGLCLRFDPKKRPGVTQLLLHPYFLSSGIGPFGF